ncbi:MAG: DUF1109 domain-containing protein [Beijerinckiaceae bacterium]
MKTKDLVRSLALDDVVERGACARAARVGYPICLLALGAAFFTFLGLRPGFDQSQILSITAMKLAITLTLATTGIAAALRAARPASSAREIALAAAPTLGLLALMLAFDIATTGVAGWETRLLGLHNWRCVFAVATLSVVPLATTLLVLQRGAVTRPTMAGAIAGLAATGIGASFYALNCTDDSPLFMLVWYGAAALIVVALGIFGARSFLKW